MCFFLFSFLFLLSSRYLFPVLHSDTPIYGLKRLKCICSLNNNNLLINIIFFFSPHRTGNTSSYMSHNQVKEFKYSFHSDIFSSFLNYKIWHLIFSKAYIAQGLQNVLKNHSYCLFKQLPSISWTVLFMLQKHINENCRKEWHRDR